MKDYFKEHFKQVFHSNHNKKLVVFFLIQTQLGCYFDIYMSGSVSSVCSSFTSFSTAAIARWNEGVTWTNVHKIYQHFIFWYSLIVRQTLNRVNAEPHFEFPLLWLFFYPVISRYSAIHLFKIKIFPLGSQSEGHHSAPVGSQGHRHTKRGSSSRDKLGLIHTCFP